MRFKNKTVLILGGDSDVAKSLIRNFISLDSKLIITTRKNNNISSIKSLLGKKNKSNCEVKFFDVLDYNAHEKFYNSLGTKPDIVICCIGILGNQKSSEKNFNESHKIINTNYTGIVSILNIIANDFEKKSSGIIVGISSVAGERGRSSNYIYGSSKAALSVYLSGLRNRLWSHNVSVISIKPGFINTKMTSNLDLPKILTASSEKVAVDIIKAIKNQSDIVYTLWVWRYIMFLIKSLPEYFFKRLRL